MVTLTRHTPIPRRSGWIEDPSDGCAVCQCCGKRATRAIVTRYLRSRGLSPLRTANPVSLLPRHSCEAVVYTVSSPHSPYGAPETGCWAFYQREYVALQPGVVWKPTCGDEEAARRLNGLIDKYSRWLGTRLHTAYRAGSPVLPTWWLFDDGAALKQKARHWPADDPVPRLKGKLAEALSDFWEVGWMPVAGTTTDVDDTRLDPRKVVEVFGRGRLPVPG